MAVSVFGSGCIIMSLSSMFVPPSIEEPSKVTPFVSALFACCVGMVLPLR